MTPDSGLTFGLVAPSGYIADPGAIGRIERYLDSRGCRLVVDPTCRSRWSRFSAPDAQRAEALVRMAAHGEVDVVLVARGGYGMSRLLDRLDYRMLAQSGKIFAGHSDFTALSLALLARAGAVTLAGPAGVFDFGCESVDPFTESHFWAMLREPTHTVTVEEAAGAAGGPSGTRSAGAGGEYSGTLWGGNLAMVCHLVGTPWLPAVEGGILFLEDVNEHPYRIERMLLQLQHAGILDAQRAVLLGVFSGYRTAENDNGFDLPTVVEAIAARTRAPILTGLPFGHIRSKITLPVGAQATVTLAAGGWRIAFSGYPLPRRSSARGRRGPSRWPGDGLAAATGGDGFAIRDADWEPDQAGLRAVRFRVFVEEQRVPEALEWDGIDSQCGHVLAVDGGGAAIGTGRLLPDGHIGRMAVLPAWRSRGVGSAMLARLIARAREAGMREAVLNAQVHATGFYARFGFVARGAPFDEAGIPHQEMFLPL